MTSQPRQPHLKAESLLAYPVYEICDDRLHFFGPQNSLLITTNLLVLWRFTKPQFIELTFDKIYDSSNELFTENAIRWKTFYNKSYRHI